MAERKKADELKRKEELLQAQVINTFNFSSGFFEKYKNYIFKERKRGQKSDKAK